MGSCGDAYDNAVAESFFATLKKELVNRRSWPSRLELQSAVFEYIEAFYTASAATPRSTCSPQQTTNNSRSRRPVLEITYSNNNNQQTNPVSSKPGQVQTLTPALDDVRERWGSRRRRLLAPGRSGSAGALPLGDLVAQSCSPALADIIGARRARTAAMISSGSIPCR